MHCKTHLSHKVTENFCLFNHEFGVCRCIVQNYVKQNIVWKMLTNIDCHDVKKG